MIWYSILKVARQDKLTISTKVNIELIRILPSILFRMTTHVSVLNGLILAGGKSSRMGSDKGVLVYHGKPQREHLFDLLQKFCKKVYLSCKSNETVPHHLNPITDTLDIDSPLNGIISAFKTDPTTAWLAIAVDMPLVDEPIIRYLLAHRDPLNIATCFLDSDGKLPEPMCTVWEPHAFPLLQDFIKTGNVSPRKFLQENNAKLLRVPDKRALININSPEDLNNFLKENQGK